MQEPPASSSAPPWPSQWFLSPYLQLCLGAFSVSASELLLKHGASTVTGNAIGWFGVTALLSLWTWLGICLYILSFVSWLYVLRFIPLGTAYAVLSVNSVLVPIGAWVFLHETISERRWIGIVLVFGGLLLILKPVAAVEAKL